MDLTTPAHDSPKEVAPVMNTNLIPMTAARPSYVGMPTGHHAFDAPKAACAWPLATLVVSTSDRARKLVLTQGEVAFQAGIDAANGTTREGQGTNPWSPPTV